MPRMHSVVNTIQGVIETLDPDGAITPYGGGWFSGWELVQARNALGAELLTYLKYGLWRKHCCLFYEQREGRIIVKVHGDEVRGKVVLTCSVAPSGRQEVMQVTYRLLRRGGYRVVDVKEDAASIHLNKATDLLYILDKRVFGGAHTSWDRDRYLPGRYESGGMIHYLAAPQY